MSIQSKQLSLAEEIAVTEKEYEDVLVAIDKEVNEQEKPKSNYTGATGTSSYTIA